jgi:undecaprenyl-diphosphatase
MREGAHETAAAAVATRFRTLDDWEGTLLRHITVSSSRSRLRTLALIVNHLGNGWLFGAVAIALPFVSRSGWSLVRVLAISLAIAFAIYPFVKRGLARVRPCDAGTDLDAGVRPLDCYSCPSGHSMTAAIFAVPLIQLFPILAPALLAGWLLIAWSRLALGHHYPSDVVFGGALGVIVAGSVCFGGW